MTHSLFLELFSEEIPACMQQDAAKYILVSIQRLLSERCKVDATGSAYYTPRRVVVHLQGIPVTFTTSVDEIRGPRIDSPAMAIEGFKRKYQIEGEQGLVQRDGFYCYQPSNSGTETSTIIKAIVEEAIKSLVWPKSMRWGAHLTKWVRPLHSILCLFAGQVLPVTYGHLTADNTTYGHRFLSPSEIVISSPETYLEQLAAASVIADPAKRKQLILDEISRTITPLGLKLLSDVPLLDEVVGLVEYPVVLLGNIPERFMHLPQELLVATLRNNQKYLLLCNQDGSLAPYFIIVSNNVAIDGGEQIIQGNQKVLIARLSDAQFFYEQDRRQPLSSKADKLKNLLFHEKIGSVYAKSQKVAQLAQDLANIMGADQTAVAKAAWLAKTDLVTSMVSEFPELQGIMGYYYALADGEGEEIAYAIMEHYKPIGPNDYIPTRPVSVAVALADKIDTLQQMFGIGIKPTGSKDPYALRRAAIGVIKIILHNGLNIQLAQFIKSDEVMQFLVGRFKVICSDSGISVKDNLESMLLATNYDMYAVYHALQQVDIP